MSSSKPSAALVEFRGVSKWYGPVIGVNEIDLRLEPGITGLFGSNGAGKTTLIKLLAGQLRPSLGDVLVCGLSAWKAVAKNHVGYCPDADAFYEDQSGRQFVYTLARLHGLGRAAARQRTEEVLDIVGMGERADRRLRGYSKGMRQRIKLAQALVQDPDILVVDEPLNGVDPVGRRELMDLFCSLARQGKALLISSHILDEMDSLADRVVFMGRGRVLASGSLAAIRQMLDQHPLHLRIRSDRTRELAGLLVDWELVCGVDVRGEELAVRALRPAEFFRRFGELVSTRGFVVNLLQTTDDSAGAIFDYVTKKVS